MEEKRKGIVNFADLILIALFLFLLIFIVFRFYDSSAERSEKTVELTVRAQVLIDKELRSNLSVGENIFYADNGKLIGTISAIEISNEIADQDDKEFAEITFTAKAIREGASYYVSNDTLSYGKKISFRNKNIFAEGTIMYISEGGENS